MFKLFLIMKEFAKQNCINHLTGFIVLTPGAQLVSAKKKITICRFLSWRQIKNYSSKTPDRKLITFCFCVFRNFIFFSKKNLAQRSSSGDNLVKN